MHPLMLHAAGVLRWPAVLRAPEEILTHLSKLAAETVIPCLATSTHVCQIFNYVFSISFQQMLHQIIYFPSWQNLAECYESTPQPLSIIFCHFLGALKSSTLFFLRGCTTIFDDDVKG